MFEAGQDFPPLAPPAILRETLPTQRSHVYPVEGSLDSPVRSTTPRIPPGLSLPHAHPSPSFVEEGETKRGETKTLSHIVGTVTPALPILPIGHRTSSPSAKGKQNLETAKSERITNDVSVSKSGTGGAPPEKKEAVAAKSTEQPSSNDLVSNQSQHPIPTNKEKESAEKDGVLKPIKVRNIGNQVSSDREVVSATGKLDTSASVASEPRYGMSPSKTDPQVLPQTMVATPAAVELLPDTPAAGTAKSPDWAYASRPKTLRLTTNTTPKVEAGPASAATERSATLSAAVLKQTSRQPSLSSISRSRPSTPTMSEHGTSAEMSRAGSPPASDVIGFPTERKKSKSQAKKERRAKSKPMSESREGSVVSTPPISEEVGPIISRQKKKKRTRENSSQATTDSNSGAIGGPEVATSTPSEGFFKPESGKSTKKTSSPPSEDQPIQDSERTVSKLESSKPRGKEKSAPVMSGVKRDQPAPVPAPRRPYTLNDLFDDAAKLPDTENALSDLLNTSISATSKLLQQLLESKDLEANSALFNAPPLNSYKLPPDPRKGADYLDANGYTMNSPFGEIYLSGHDRKQLLQGRDVRLSDSNKPQDVLKRSMITPTGTIFRHLSADEEGRVIELENRIRENEEKFGITGKSDIRPLDETDFMNLSGGLQELMAFPPMHRISLLTAEPGIDGAEDDDADFNTNNSDETEDEMAPLASGFGAAPEGPMRKPMTPNTMKRKAEALMAVNLRNLDLDKLQKRIRETQVEMEGARKEAEALEKKAARKAKEVARWREALLKEVGRGL